MVGWRTAGAGRMEEKKERDLNQSSSKMECVRRGKEEEKGGDVEEDAGESGKVLLAGKWVEAPLLSPALSTSCTGGAVIGLGTAWCPAAAYPMSPVKRGRIRGAERGKAVGPLCPLGPGPVDWLPAPAAGLPGPAGWTSISVGQRVQLDAHREPWLNLAWAQSAFAPVFFQRELNVADRERKKE